MENELYHYGVLGMKWGVRRYQNPDGSLTSKGKEHYTNDFTGQKAKKKMASDAAHMQYRINKLNSKVHLSKKKAAYRDSLVTKRNSLIKDLSDRDIEYGQHMFNMKKNLMLSTFWLGPAGTIGYAVFGKAPKKVLAMEIQDAKAKRK